MSLILPLLPLAAFLLGFLYLLNARNDWDQYRCFLRAAVFFGGYTVLATELLGVVHGLVRPAVAGIWLLPIGILGFLIVRVSRGRSSLRLPKLLGRRSGPEWVMILALGMVLAATATVAFFAPPNTWDSLTYHMSRVAHWAQGASLNHYATGVERQNLMAPGAEIAVLQAYLLAAGDQLANFPQWLAMAASLVAAGAIARLLGASRIGQFCAAVFVATLPMGIAQATSTMTDYVVAFWVVCVAYETVALVQDPAPEWPSVVILGLAAGLGVLTKPTAVPFLAPFAVAAAVTLLVKQGIRSWLVSAGLVTILVLGINAGYMGRNLHTYGRPLGSESKVERHSNELFNGAVFVSNLLRNASLHAGTPWPAVNKLIFTGILWTHLKLGLGLTDPRTSIHSTFRVDVPKPDEVSSGNPLHALLGLIVLILLILRSARGDRRSRFVLGYLGAAVLGFALLSSIFKFTVFGSRYHVAFFVLLGPAFGVVVGRLGKPWLAAGASVLLLLSSSSSILEMGQRPLLRDRRGNSVVVTPRQTLYFMVGRGLEEPYETVVNEVKAAGCASVGIMLSGNAAEYPLWPLLGAPSGDIRLEWIVSGTPSARYRDESFSPCAIICDGSCPDEWTSVRELPLALEKAPLRLFMAP